MDQTTQVLSQYASALTYADLPPEVVHHVKRTLIDTLGCAMGAFHAEPAGIARLLARQVTSQLPSRLLGTRQYSSPDLAGFANGVMIRYLDCNDSYFSPGGGHPSDMIAAVLALADPLQCDGRTVITAIVLAYEVFCRLSDQVVAGDLGWDQGMFSVLGAVCGAGKILGLTPAQMGHAIVLAITPNLPLGATRVGELSMWKGCATASATRAAVFAAQLAQAGMSGPEKPFDGRRGLWEQAGVSTPIVLERFGGHGEPFRIMHSLFKSYPSQIHTQGPISLALQLRPQVALADIASLRIHAYASAVSSAATEPAKWAPQTRETADHSIPYLVAVAFADGAVTPDSFTPQRLHDPALRSFLDKMSITEDPAFTQNFPEQYGCRMEVLTRSGQRLEAATAYPPGHRHNPLSDTGVAEKFTHLASAVLSPAQCRQSLDILWTIDQAANFQALFEALVLEGTEA